MISIIKKFIMKNVFVFISLIYHTNKKTLIFFTNSN